MPTTVTLHLQIKNKPVGFVLPQIVHRGTWDGYLINTSDMGQQWTKFETTQLARYIDTDLTSQTLDLSLSLPPSIINLGDVSHLVIRSGEEGSPPPTGEEDSCAECDRRIEYAAIKLVLAW
jgi:hypothetical protein